VRLHTNGRLLALPENVRLGWKWVEKGNTLAYCNMATITAVIFFYSTGPSIQLDFLTVTLLREKSNCTKSDKRRVRRQWRRIKKFYGLDAFTKVWFGESSCMDVGWMPPMSTNVGAMPDTGNTLCWKKIATLTDRLHVRFHGAFSSCVLYPSLIKNPRPML